MFQIQFQDRRGQCQLLDREPYSYHSREIAEMVAESLSNTNNPAWQGTFTVVDDALDIARAA